MDVCFIALTVVVYPLGLVFSVFCGCFNGWGVCRFEFKLLIAVCLWFGDLCFRCLRLWFWVATVWVDWRFCGGFVFGACGVCCLLWSWWFLILVLCALDGGFAGLFPWVVGWRCWWVLGFLVGVGFGFLWLFCDKSCARVASGEWCACSVAPVRTIVLVGW